MSTIPSEYKTLFWDYEINHISLTKHKQFIIERLLEKGNLDTLEWLFQNYSIKDIKGVITISKNLSPKTANFWYTAFNYAQN